VIDERLVLGIAKDLHDVLAAGLDVDSNDAHERERCAKLVAEAPRIAEKRERLMARQRRLLAAKKEVLNVY